MQTLKDLNKTYFIKNPAKRKPFTKNTKNFFYDINMDIGKNQLPQPDSGRSKFW